MLLSRISDGGISLYQRARDSMFVVDNDRTRAEVGRRIPKYHFDIRVALSRDMVCISLDLIMWYLDSQVCSWQQH